MPGETPVEASTLGSGRRFGFVPAFDGLRGVAVLLVVAVHFRRIIDPWTTRWIHSPALARALSGGGEASSGWVLTPKPHLSLVAQLVPKGGFLGVDIFFVLSGFLITSLLLREQAATGGIKFGGFYRRRALRLLPALLCFVVVQFIYASLGRVPASVEGSSVIAVMLYYFNWKLIYSATAAIPIAFRHLWSLSIEEQFYLVWPLTTMFLLGVRRRFSTVLVAFCGSILAIAIWRVILTHHMARYLVYFRTDARADSLLVGALAAHMWVRGRIPPKRFLVPAAWVSVAFLTVCLYTIESTDHFLYDGGFTAIALAVAIILFATLETDWRASRVLELRPLRAVGRVSYGLYLWHLLAFSAVAGHTRTAPVVVRIVAGLAAAAVLTLLSWYFVERPFLKWKDRLEEGREARPPDRDDAGLTPPGN